MDERQQQIKAGAGLEDSRINEDFKEFLEKWGTWLLVVVALAFGAMWGYQKLEERRVNKVNAAFAAYEGAAGSTNPNPQALLQVAEEYDGVRAVPDLARLRSADIFLHAARTGLRPGAEFTPEGELMSEDDLLSDEEIGRYIDQAQGLYGQVYESASASGSILAIDAAFGMGAAGESKGDAEIARRGYEAAKQAAEKHGRPILARVAEKRLEAISDGVPARPTLYASTDLPELPRYEPPAPTPVETQIPVVGEDESPEADPADDSGEAPTAPEGGEAAPEDAGEPEASDAP
jgi:hypothetical protein